MHDNEYWNARRDDNPHDDTARPNKTDSGPNRAERRASKTRHKRPTSPHVTNNASNDTNTLDPLAQQRVEAFFATPEHAERLEFAFKKNSGAT